MRSTDTMSSFWAGAESALGWGHIFEMYGGEMGEIKEVTDGNESESYCHQG